VTYPTNSTDASTSSTPNTSAAPSSTSGTSTNRAPRPGVSSQYDLVSLKEKLFRGLNVWTVFLSLGFSIAFFIRTHLSYYFWNYATVTALLSYLISLSNHLENRWPTSYNTQTMLVFFTALSESQDFRYCLYCWVLLHTQQISLVAVFPLGVYALFSSSQFFTNLLLYVGEKLPAVRSVSEFLKKILHSHATLAYWAAAAEILTFFILLWRYLSGMNGDMSLIDLLLLGQFILQRYSTSEHTRGIIQSSHAFLKKYIPIIPDMPIMMPR